MTNVTQTWQPGDRVAVMLPDKSLPYAREVRVEGTVREVDPPRVSTRGVVVDLDREINGIRDCFASHGELVRA